ncbi:hypothetical protein HAX54_027182 [Datura stramonium]|uniref:Uncharacterized protein n=1 Tax=Datura stramonium TaxID=4076 RepID=A0ABS8RKH8_DATST|nr:hypothetical protein [Datura stramonium]
MAVKVLMKWKDNTMNIERADVIYVSSFFLHYPPGILVSPGSGVSRGIVSIGKRNLAAESEEWVLVYPT